jgi:hypothetical protein
VTIKSNSFPQPNREYLSPKQGYQIENSFESEARKENSAQLSLCLAWKVIGKHCFSKIMDKITLSWFKNF